MKEEQVGQKMPGSWFYEEDTTSCSPVSDPEDIAQFLNYRASIGVQNVTQSVEVPTSEHVAEIVGRQGCKIKALRAKTNTYIKTPIRGEDPIFVVTGRLEDVQEAKREIECAAEHFTQIRASRRHSQVVPGAHAPGQVTSYVRVPLRVVGLVVGPKGATIKRIQQDTHTYIITPSREREPVFEVTGLPHNVEAARKEIETHIFQRTGNLPETDHDVPGQYVGVSMLQQAQQHQQQQSTAASASASAAAAATLYRKAFSNSNIFNQLNNDLPHGMESSLGLDALFRSFPSMRNSLTSETLQGLGRSSAGNMPAKSRPSLGGQPTKPEVPTYDYWGNNNSINDIMENEILSRNYNALSAWSSLGENKEKREESPINGLMSLKSGSSSTSGFGFLNTIWSDNLNLSPGSLASASASPASSSCDHNDHTLVPING
uniref:K Homology domain-containing protein n=1 Tax=Caenorhabditis japonica TaxID=281687 RepID=A0A8R1I8L5_CAEJA